MSERRQLAWMRHRGRNDATMPGADVPPPPWRPRSALSLKQRFRCVHVHICRWLEGVSACLFRHPVRGRRKTGMTLSARIHLPRCRNRDNGSPLMLGGPLCGQLGVWLRLAASRSVKSRFRSRSGPQRARTPILQFLAPARRNFSKFLQKFRVEITCQGP